MSSLSVSESVRTLADAPPTVRSVESIHGSTAPHWVGDGFLVSTYFPSALLSAERVSPFLLMDYGPPREFAPLAQGKRGVGWHPHRGFETVTVAWEGSVAHRDNAGHADVIGPGDVQWMTAGAGIFHEEYLEEALTRAGGRLHMMQLWVNLPREHKATAPAYQPLKASQFPNIVLPGGSVVRVIAGEHAGARGPARSFTPLTLLDIQLRAGEQVPVRLPGSYNALAVVVEGRLRAGQRSASAGELVLFANDGELVALDAEEDAHVILLSGEPINEPIVQYGPFVMNSVQEIRQAMLDVSQGKFGTIPD